VLIRRVVLSVLLSASPAGAQGVFTGVPGARAPFAAAVPPVEAPRPVELDDGSLVPGGELVEGEPVVRVLSRESSAVLLDGIFNKHWTGVDRFTHDGKTFEVSVTFDLVGESYLGVLPPGEVVPNFSRLERSMDGRWRTGALNYRADVRITNIFCKICNHIRIQADRAGSVYDIEIQDLVNKAYAQGAQVKAGGREFRVYFSNDLDRQPNGRIVNDRFGIVIAYDRKQGSGSPDLKRLIVPFSELSAGQAKKYKVKDGPTLILRIDPATRTLYFSAP